MKASASGPIGFPPIEGAFFFDAGMAWNQGNQIVWPWQARDPAANKRDVPYQSLIKTWLAEKTDEKASSR